MTSSRRRHVSVKIYSTACNFIITEVSHRIPIPRQSAADLARSICGDRFAACEGRSSPSVRVRSVRRMLDHCGLPFERACVDFHKTQRSVRTPSSEQVRQPSFRDSLEQWVKYEPWLGSLKAALGDAVVRYRE
jgi:hypothetical protein